MSDRGHLHRAPHDCPVCGADVVVTRLGCPSCGSELAGEFASCGFCALDEADLAMLKVFLASRGNLREVEKHLGVSYPTARARFTELLVRLGLSGEADQPLGRDEILAEVAAGRMTPDVAQELLLKLG